MQYKLSSPFSIPLEVAIHKSGDGSLLFPSQRPIRYSQSDRWLNNSPMASFDMGIKNNANIFSRQPFHQEFKYGQNGSLSQLYLEKRTKDNYQHSILSQINNQENNARLIDFTRDQASLQTQENSKFPYIQKMLNNAQSHKDGKKFAIRDSSQIGEKSALDYSLSQIDQAKINRAVAMGWISQDEEQRKNTERAKMVMYMQELSVQIEEKQKYKEKRFQTEQSSQELKRKQYINHHDINRSPLDNSYLIGYGNSSTQKGYFQEYFNLSSSENRSQIDDHSNPFSMNYQEHHLRSYNHQSRNDKLSLEKLIMAKRSTQDLQSSTEKQLEDLKIEMEIMRLQKKRAQEELETLQANIRKQIHARNQNSNDSGQLYQYQEFQGGRGNTKNGIHIAGKHKNGLNLSTYALAEKDKYHASPLQSFSKRQHNKQDTENSLTLNESQISKKLTINSDSISKEDPNEIVPTQLSQDKNYHRDNKSSAITEKDELDINNQNTIIEDQLLTEQQSTHKQNDSSDANQSKIDEGHSIHRSQLEGEDIQNEVLVDKQQQIKEQLPIIIVNPIVEKNNDIKQTHENSNLSRNRELNETVKHKSEDQKGDKSISTSGNTSLLQQKSNPAFRNRVLSKYNIPYKQVSQNNIIPQQILNKSILSQLKGGKISPRQQHQDKHIKQSLAQILENIESMVSAQTRSLTHK